jgi:hypothetical protein
MARTRLVSSVGLGRVGSCLPVLCVRFFCLRVGFFSFGSGFSGWIRFWVKNHGPYPARELLRVKKYDPYPSIGLVRPGRTEFFRVGRVELVRLGGPWSGLPESLLSLD